MSRVVRAPLFGVVLLVPGCATDPGPLAKRSAQTRTKTVKQVCTTTSKPADVCAQRRDCEEIKTCADAYYRYTVCKDTKLDTGSTIDGKPRWPANGFPCEKLCSKDALTMAKRISDQPIVIPNKQETVCTHN